MTYEYIAGFLDGEGCIYLPNRKPNKGTAHVPAVSMAQTSLPVLESIQEFLGKDDIRSHIYTKPGFHNGKRSKNIHSLRIMGGREAVVKFLSKVLPFLIVKREKAKRAITHIKETKWKRENISEEQLEAAAKEVAEGSASTRKVCRTHGVWRRGLKRYIQKNRKRLGIVR